MSGDPNDHFPTGPKPLPYHLDPSSPTLPPLTFGHRLDEKWPPVSQTAGPLPGAVEVRVVDAKTGGEKGQKLERFDLIPTGPWRALARLFGRGAVKYADRNWEKGYAWGLSIGALQRHLALWLSGLSYDTADGTKGGPIDLDENGKPIHTGEHHLICVAWHCFALTVFESRGLGTDDRAPSADV